MNQHIAISAISMLFRYYEVPMMKKKVKEVGVTT